MDKQDFKLTLFVGDVDESLSLAALSKDPEAFLISHNNVEFFLAGTLERNTTVYTALGDLPKDLDIFIELCMSSDEIVYCPPDIWSDHKTVDNFNPGACVQGLTETILILVSDRVLVTGLDLTSWSNPIQLVDNRKTVQPQLWIAGCSISHGIGITANERYGQILSNKLNLACSFLTRPGAAIDWASDQIIRSDIKRGDIVVFGVTNVERLTYVYDQELVGVTTKTYKIKPHLNKIFPEHNLVTENTFYQHVTAIERVINFCNKVGATLVLVGLLSQTNPNLMRFLTTIPNFVQYPYKITFNNTDLDFIDLGNDQRHPGPIQHSLYADFILKYLTTQKIRIPKAADNYNE